MKKNIIFIITLLLVILTTNNVYAYKEGSLIGTGVEQVETNYSAWGIHYYKHYATINGDKDKKFILCMQGGYAASSSRYLYVSAVLDNDKESQRAYNAGMQAIFHELENVAKYENLNVVSAQQAARIFNLMWYHANLSPKVNPGDDKICGGQLCGHYKVTAAFYNKYLANSELKSAMLSATGKKSLKKVSGITTSAVDTVTDNMVDDVKKYFNLALTAAAKARKNVSTGVTLTKLSRQSKNVVSNSNSYVEYTSKITGLNSLTSEKSYLRIECDGCESKIQSVYAKTSTGNYEKIALGGTGYGTNLKAKAGSSGELTVLLVVSKSTDCTQSKVTLKVTGEGSDYSLYIAGDKSVGPKNGYQQFLVYIPDTDGVSKTTTISPCKGC